MTKVYPNLELLEYMFRQRIPPYEKPLNDVEIYMFPQSWSNAGGGMSEAGYMYGQAITTQFTTVLVSRDGGIAMVCFDDMPGYMVSPLTGGFWHDLERMHMAGYRDRHKYEKADGADK